ncbi:MAG: Stp1/IreP family PP2C-type Ser/Thr phosphatase [Firmicutes bacterium]|nr:Stp1/IreP family PP2C-type Ser/Thr phosphatase [Bacillota bacterium]
MIQIGFKCNRGVVRQNNEDACFVMPSHDVYIVADGVGGNNSGEIASRTAVETIASYVKEKELEKCETTENIFEFLTAAIDTANAKIFTSGMTNPQHRGMATTLVMIYIKDNIGYIVNIGDSRAYVLRNGKLSQITVDHTYVNELIAKGVITEDEAENHIQKNVITKALGAERFAEPDFYQINLKSDDVIMLCSDGLYGEVNEDRITDLIINAETMNGLTADLVDEANRAGGRDNITVVCIRV